MNNTYKKIYNEILSQNAINTNQLSTPKKDIENIRLAIIGELDAINLYEQIAETTNNPKIKQILLDIAREEKVHVGELQKILDMLDPQNKPARKQGKKEAEDEI